MSKRPSERHRFHEDDRESSFLLLPRPPRNLPAALRTSSASVTSRVAHLRPGIADGLFLALVVVLSLSLYVDELGFYSDDWDFLAVLHNAGNESVFGLSRVQYESNPNLELRPTQAVYQAILYSLFGLDPLGYHLVHAAVLVTMVVLLYVVLRGLELSRAIAVAIPAVYALLPHYSTDRFWFAAFGYALSMALFFAGLYADLRAIRTSRWRLGAWKALALSALVVAGMGYEIVLPFFLAAPLVVSYQARRRFGGLRSRLGTTGSALFVGSTVVFVLLIVFYKAQTDPGGTVPLDAHALGWHATQLVFGSTLMSFGTYGIALPLAVSWAMRHADVLDLLLAALVGLVALVYVMHLLRLERTRRARSWLGVIVAGLAVFALGYSVFITTWRIGFTSTGINNRVAIAGALGVSMVAVGLAGLVSSAFPRRPLGRLFFASSVAAICTSGFLVVNALAHYWERAWKDQHAVLAEIERAFPTLAPGDTIILHGVCPYRGPAIVFESNWDLSGALRVRYREPTVRADITLSEVFVVGRRGLSTTLYGSLREFYPYGRRLFLFDRPQQAVLVLRNQTAARRYLADTRGASRVRCPAGKAGDGVKIFAFDELYEELEARGFWVWW